MEDFNLCKEVSPALVKDVDRSVKVTQLRRLNTAKNGAECQGDFALQAKATVCSTQLVMELSGKAMLLVQALPCPTWDTQKDSLHDTLGRRQAHCQQAKLANVGISICREVALMDRQRKEADVKHRQALKGFLGAK